MSIKSNIYKAALALGLGGIIASCADQLEINTDNSYLSKMAIRFAAPYPTATRASDAGFEDGDRMGVYVMDYLGETPQEIDDSKVHASNVRFDFNGPDNTWSGATTLYWSGKDIDADIVAYYPFMESISNPKEFEFQVASRQDKEGDEINVGGYESSDFLYAKATKVVPTSERIDLSLNHLMAGVKVRFLQGDGFSSDEWAEIEKRVIISNVYTKVAINLETGSLAEESGELSSIIPMEYNGEWRGVVPPQSIEGGRTLLTLTVDGVGYEYKRNEEISLVSGKLHTFTITVNRKEHSGDLEFVAGEMSISAWLDDTDFRDGIMRQYVIVACEEKGNLKDSFLKNGVSYADVQNLKIKGEINEADFRFMKEECGSLKSLNLHECEVYDGERRGVICYQALWGKSTLNHIMWPKYLKVIGQGAFGETGLMGDLIIPEGVTHVGTELDRWGAFYLCYSLVGTLSLPSTLEYIGGGAFLCTNLTGNLLIPDKVKVIGENAFDTSNFTGSLSLPENIEFLGQGCFTNVPFTGTLRIPQGIKKLPNDIFRECTFDMVILPEGLEEIGSAAFRTNKLKGELVLPSTLKVIAQEAFRSNQISSIVWPKSLVFLGKEAFGSNKRLSGTLEIPSSLRSINNACFFDCPMLEEIVIPESIEKIEERAFENCYNLTSIIVNNSEPPVLGDAFRGVPKDNFTLQVPKKAVNAYLQAQGWKEFKRIAEYSGFVSRPVNVSALNTAHSENIILNSDTDWEIVHKPEWCKISAESGKGKTELNISLSEMQKGTGNREDYVEFLQPSTGYTTRCTLRQYDYDYGEDECLVIQKASTERGSNIVFVAEGYDAESISKGEYLTLVKRQIEYFFGLEPYTTYRDRFNVYVIFSLSQESGVNTANKWRNNRFGTTFSLDCDGSTGSLFVEDMDEVFSYAIDHSPLERERLWASLVIMTLNCDEYGSATLLREDNSAISICPPSALQYPMDTRGVVQHEACGHGFAKLADEVINSNRYLTNGEADEILRMQRWHGWYRNISTSGSLSDVAWKHFIFDPRYSDKVDVFEGAFGVTRGVYRSELNSCMNYGIPYFNAISRQTIMHRILDCTGEGFTLEKFYDMDSDRWGTVEDTRAINRATPTGMVNSGLHRAPKIINKKKINKK